MTHITDHGPEPFLVNIETATLDNTDYRQTLWTGKNIQLTLMAIEPGDDIGLEVHPTHDQFIRIEQGVATVYTGKDKDNLTAWDAGADDALFVPAGTWHNLVNKGDDTLKLYTVYGPPDHLPGTVHHTKEDADSDPNEQSEA
ncbi:MAG: cupin protein [Candidatus Saccharibacteria bacterium]|nr:cupin protein [Candidatus Saccharibacteria bacterium]